MTHRVVFCPACGARYDIEKGLLTAAELLVLCGVCRHAAKMALFDAPPPPQPTELESTHWPRVVVAHEVPAALTAMAHVLRASSLSPVLVRSGEEVLAAFDRSLDTAPAAVVMDVAIPGVMAVSVIEQLRANQTTDRVPIVLLASVYERTRYKRKATNLYGADAYLELHHVPDRLGLVLTALINKSPVPDERNQAPVERARAVVFKSTDPINSDDEARALARRLISDCILYNGDEVARGVHQGQPFSSLQPALADVRAAFLAAAARPEIFDAECRAFEIRLMDRGGPKRAE